jgi:bacterioferritin-associated ferredoxin
MYICVCAAVTDRAIRAAVAEGANSLDDLRIDLGVAMNCGSCAQAAEHVICETMAKLLHLKAYEVHGEAGNPARAAANASVASSEQHLAAQAPRRVWPILEVA